MTAVTPCSSADSKLHHSDAVPPPAKWSSELTLMSTPLFSSNRARASTVSGSPSSQRATLTV